MMTLPASSPDAAADAPAILDPGRLNGTNINPVTLLATDYLNHFNEAIMLLEMIPTAPECKEDFLTWRPLSYCSHFAQSRFKHRELAIAAYEVADPKYRNEIDQIARHMSMILLATCDAMRNELSPHTMGVLAETTARWLRPLVARAGAVINGEIDDDDTAATSDAAPQDTIDALFDREVEEALRA
jgi:hypothetical protein